MKTNKATDLPLNLRQLANKVRVAFTPADAGTLMLAANCIEGLRNCYDSVRADAEKAQKERIATEETPAKSAEMSELWVSDVIAMLHAVAGDLSEDNRIMALAAQSLILQAPRLSCVADGLWRDWFGGERPVGFHDIVEAKFRDGTESGGFPAGEMVWHHDGQATDIIFWRLVERHHGSEN